MFTANNILGGGGNGSVCWHITVLLRMQYKFAFDVLMH